MTIQVVLIFSSSKKRHDIERGAIARLSLCVLPFFKSLDSDSSRDETVSMETDRLLQE